MTIMRSCCCWRSVRRGSFACAVYAVCYYSVMAVTIASVLKEESQYLAGNRSRPKSNSLLELEVSPVTMKFNVAFLVCSACGVICCVLLLYGLYKDEKLFLVPWICIVIVCCLVDILHLIFIFFLNSLVFTPVTAMLLTFDFFMLCLNAYSVLCVISQYQEYAAGRGTATDDQEPRMLELRYRGQATTTATSCLSSRRTPTIVETRTTTPTQSPTTLPNQPNDQRSPVADRTTRKHVKFPDAPDGKVAAQLKVGRCSVPGADNQFSHHQKNSLNVILDHRNGL